MNIKPLRKHIIKESIVFVVLFAFFSGVTVCLVMVNDDFNERKDSAQREANQVRTEIQALEQKFTNVKNNLAVYDQSKKHLKEQGLFIDSQAVRDLFNSYQAPLFLRRISVEMRPVSDVSDKPEFNNEHFIATQTIAQVSLEAVSDQDMYQLIDIMNESLPGYIKVTNMSLNKDEELSKKTLSEIARRGSYPMIKGQMTFDWYGIRSKDENSPINKYVSRKYKVQQP